MREAASWSPASCGRLYREGDSVDSRVATPGLRAGSLYRVGGLPVLQLQRSASCSARHAFLTQIPMEKDGRVS